MKLKPCPFCGCAATAMMDGRNGPWVVFCNNDGTLGDDVVTCGCSGPVRREEAEAIAAWNTRVGEGGTNA